jgi:hypothetical protein
LLTIAATAAGAQTFTPIQVFGAWHCGDDATVFDVTVPMPPLRQD